MNAEHNKFSTEILTGKHTISTFKNLLGKKGLSKTLPFVGYTLNL